MPISCPTGSTLPCFCIGGQLQPTCCDTPGDWPRLKVTTQLMGAGSDPVIDPTNCAIFVDSVDSTIIEGSAGCWCTCDLPANYNPDNPDLALQPSNLFWKISVFAETNDGPFELVAGPFEVSLNGAADYSELGECCIISGPCGDCINITCLLDAPATDPPVDRFCNAVHACLSPIVGTGLLQGNITGNYDDGWAVDLTCEDIDSCLPDLVMTTDGTANGVDQSGPHDHVVDLTILSTGADNILSTGGDGGVYLSCAAVWTCLAPIEGAGLLEGNVTGDYENGWSVDLSCADIDSCLPDLVVTTDGDTTGVTQSGDHDHIADIVVTDSDATNIAEVGPNGGTLLTCESVLGCLNFEYLVFDPTTHDPGVIEGDGSAATPFQIPLPQIDVEITDITISNTVVNPDGSTTVTYTVSETDDGDADAPAHDFDVVFPAAAEMNFIYIAYDPAVHDGGNIEGDGSAANPWQIPLPCCDTFEYVVYDPAVHDVGPVEGDGSVGTPYQIPVPPPIVACDLLSTIDEGTGLEILETDEIIVIDDNGDCIRKSLPDNDCCYTNNLLSDPNDDCSPVTVVIDVLNGGAQYFDANGVTWTGDPNSLLPPELCGGSAICDALSALDPIDATAKPASTVGIDDAGNCVLVEATPVIYADAAGEPWDETNANWVDPANCPEFTELRVYNDPASGGTAIYRNLEETLGAATGLQWHQIA